MKPKRFCPPELEQSESAVGTTANQNPLMHLVPISISNARVISGAGRGRRIGIPTINLDLSCTPQELQHGIYACFITIGNNKYRGAMHYGLRPVFKDTGTLEVHVLDAAIEELPATADIDIVGRIRDVQDFPSTETLQSAIAADILAVRAMLDAHEKASEKHRS